MVKKVGKPPKGWFQPTQEWDPGYPGTPGQIPGIAEQLTRGFGGSVADNMDYLGQMYQPMFADKKDPYITPPPAAATGGGIALDDPRAAQQVADMFRTQVISHMPGQSPVYGSFIGGNDDKWMDAKKPWKKRLKMMKKGKLVAPTQIGGGFRYDNSGNQTPFNYDPYQ